jgi:hypothetical protein
MAIYFSSIVEAVVTAIMPEIKIPNPDEPK